MEKDAALATMFKFTTEHSATTTRLYSQQRGYGTFGRAKTAVLFLLLWYLFETCDISTEVYLNPLFTKEFRSKLSKNGLHVTRNSKTHKEIPMFTDFLLRGKKGNLALTVLNKTTLNSPAENNKFKVEKLLWASKNIPFCEIYEEELNPVLVQNLRRILAYNPIYDDPDPAPAEAFTFFLERYTECSEPVVLLARETEKKYNLPQNFGINIYFFLAAEKLVPISIEAKPLDLTIPRDIPEQPLSLLRECDLYRTLTKHGMLTGEPTAEEPMSGNNRSISPQAGMVYRSNGLEELPSLFRIIRYNYSSDVYVFALPDRGTECSERPYRINKEKFLYAIKEGQIQSVEDPYIIPNLSDVKNKTKKLRWAEELEKHPLLDDMVTRHAHVYRDEIRKIAAAMNASEKTAHRYVIRFYRGLKRISDQTLVTTVEALSAHIPGKTAKKGRPSSLTADDFRQFHDGTLFYCNDEYHSKHNAYLKTLSEYVSSPEISVIPSERQFIYHANKWMASNAEDALRRGTYGTQYDLTYRPVLEHLDYGLIGSGYCYETDATPLDYNLVSSINRSKLIGRPICLFYVDLFSRAIVGFALTLSGEDFDLYREGLACTASNKAEYVSNFGLTISPDAWPMHHVPNMIRGDNSALKILRSDNIPDLLHISLENVRSRRGDLKGVIESRHNIFNAWLRDFIPGYINVKKGANGGHGYENDAALTFAEMRTIIVLFIIAYNSAHITAVQPGSDIIMSDTGFTPNELWTWGMMYRSGIQRTLSPEHIRIALSHTTRASVTEKGLLADNLYYINPNQKYQNWFSLSRKKNKTREDHSVLSKKTLYSDDNDISIKYYYDRDIGEFVPFMLSGDAFHTFCHVPTLEAKKLVEEFKMRRLCGANAQNDHRRELIKQVKAIAENARKETARTCRSNGKLDTKNVTLYRDRENDKIKSELS